MTHALLLHGLGGAAADYDAVRPHLPADWHVEAPELTGDFDDASKHAADRLAAGALLVGHSMGGHVALAAARRAARAEARLVLLAPGGVGPAPPPALVAAAFSRDALCAMTPQAIEARSRSRFADPRHPAADRLVAERLAMHATPALTAWAEQVERHVGGVTRRWIGDAADTPGRLWIAHGAADTMVPPALSAALAAAHPRATLRIWTDAGHMLPHECPDRVAALIVEAAQPAPR
ncbi:MAG: alpha/beta hydrolase [bacterium]